MRFTQVKLRTSDPGRLARFYEEALDCSVLLPLTSLADPASRGVGAPGRQVEILVLSLPGVEDGTTLELIAVEGDQTTGQGMLAFFVDDVAVAVHRVIAAGGGLLGEITTFVAPSGNLAQFVFATDPEGNVVDLFSLV